MIRSVRLILLLLIAAITSGSAAAQIVDARLLADSVSIGARYQLVVAVSHDGDRAAVFPDQFPDPDRPRGLVGRVGDFELLARIESGSSVGPAGGRRDSVVYQVAVFEVDTVRATPVVGLATELDTLLLAGAPIWAPVRSFVTEEAEDVRDLAPLADFPRVWWPWILGLALLAAAAYLLLRRRPPQEIALETAPDAPIESPFDEADRRLHELEDPGAAESIKPYYVELTDILRTYVGRALDVPALETTTRELLYALRYGRRLDETELRSIAKLLQEADLVKFADFMPDGESRAAHRSQTRGFIERTEAHRVPEAQPEEVE